MADPSGPIYLDHNASTPILPEVLEAMLPYLAEHYGNPSSPHVFGRSMRRAVEQAREQVASLIECDASEVFFTSGGTEANNLAIRGVAAAHPDRRQIVTSVIEHPATSAPCAHLERLGFRIDRAGVDESGLVKTREVELLTGDRTLLVTVMHANSETGSLQPITELSGIAHASDALMHADAAQSLGKVPVSVREEKIDLLSIAGHKLYAPQGIGALFVRSGIAIEPVVLGAGHERGLRPGTENVASIVGLGRACATAKQVLAEEAERISRLRDRLWNLLNAQVPGLGFNGHPVKRLPNTLNVRFPEVSGNALLAACPDIAAATGSACHATGDTASAVILAMGIPADEALGSVRLTLGRGNDAAQIDRAAEALIRAWRQLTGR